MRALVLALRFLSELALLAGAVVGGWRIGGGGALGMLIAIVGVAVVVAVWGGWIAPKARRRIDDPGRLVVELALFAVVGIVLAAGGAALAGAVLSLAGGALAVAVRAVGGDAAPGEG